MKLVARLGTALLAFTLLFTLIIPYTVDAKGSVHVRGYFRKDGTYVKPHYRTSPDSSKSNNWSYCGNTNPNTGKTGTVDCGGGGVSLPPSTNINPPTPKESTSVTTPQQKPSTKKESTAPVVSTSNMITLGSTEKDVIRIMGKPSERSSISFTYDYSLIFFDSDGKVSGWAKIGDTPLKVTLGKKKEGAKSFTVGSSKQDVVNAMGTPDSVDSRSFTYGYSLVFFNDDGKVDGWATIGDTKLKATLGQKNPKSQGFSIGSTKQEVIGAMGTPDSVDERRSFTYQYSLVFFDNGVVSSYSDISNNLKIKD